MVLVITRTEIVVELPDDVTETEQVATYYFRYRKGNQTVYRAEEFTPDELNEFLQILLNMTTLGVEVQTEPFEVGQRRAS